VHDRQVLAQVWAISSKNKDLGDSRPDFTKALVLFNSEHMCFGSISSHDEVVGEGSNIVTGVVVASNT